MKIQIEQSKHTQGEWNVNLTNEIMPDLAIFCNGLQIATLEPLANKKEKEANANRIIKAVNMHDELIELLKNASIRLRDIAVKAGRGEIPNDLHQLANDLYNKTL